MRDDNLRPQHMTNAAASLSTICRTEPRCGAPRVKRGTSRDSGHTTKARRGASAPGHALARGHCSASSTAAEEKKGGASEARKAAQTAVDGGVKLAVGGKDFTAYLKATFALSKGDLPHAMKF